MPYALVLAGGTGEGALEQELELSSKVFALIGERPMLSYVLEALAEASAVTGCLLVGAPAELRSVAAGITGLPPLQVVAQGESLLDNLRKGLEAAPRGEEWILIVTGDIPLVNAGMLEDLVSACSPEDGEFFYPIVRREVCEERYPLTRRTFVRLRDGTFTGGNVFVARRDALVAALELAKNALAARKKPWRLGLMLGPGLIVRWLFRALSIQDVEERVSRLVGFRCRALIFPHPEIAVDVDKPEDLQLVRAALA